jgi:SAM-dependent methyltransferase
MDAASDPDILWDLEQKPWPVNDNSFDQVHAYEVLEHLGRQGDFRSFFADFAEIYRILKPGGYLVFSCPLPESVWAWGDPGHTRIISLESLTFLDQSSYSQVGTTPMADYRNIWKGDLPCVGYQKTEHNLFAILQARKAG